MFAKALDIEGNVNLLSPALKGKDNLSHPESSLMLAHLPYLSLTTIINCIL